MNKQMQSVQIEFFNMKLLLSSLVLVYSVNFIQGYNILGVFPYCAHSHFKVGFRLLKELADRGHNVTMVSCFPQKTPIENFRDISVAETIEDTNEINSRLSDYRDLTFWGRLKLGMELGDTYIRNFFKTKIIQKLVKSNETFDIVIMENMVNDAMVIFHHVFNCPLILVTPGRLRGYSNYLLGNVALPSFVPNDMSDYGSRMDFWQRLENTYRQLCEHIFINFYHVPNQAKIVKDFFPDAPDLHTILYNASMLLTNSHVSLNDFGPIQKNIKEIGGFHVLPPKALPKNIQEYLNNASHGAILFSMGSILRSVNLKLDMRKAILTGFANIKQKVIWKFETDLPEKPDNVLILDWVPQQDILAHPNVVGFISHGGILSTFEAIYHGVPIMGLPVFFDQITNIDDAVRLGCAVKINLEDLNEESFGLALNEIIHNPNYKKIAKERSRIMHDQPMKQIDKAVFWVEYVIRHKGAEHLKSPGRYLKWYQLYLIDIILFVAAILFVILLVLMIIIKALFSKKMVDFGKVKQN